MTEGYVIVGASMYCGCLLAKRYVGMVRASVDIGGGCYAFFSNFCIFCFYFFKCRVLLLGGQYLRSEGSMTLSCVQSSVIACARSDHRFVRCTC